jgi:hypothetical protein
MENLGVTCLEEPIDQKWNIAHVDVKFQECLRLDEEDIHYLDGVEGMQQGEALTIPETTVKRHVAASIPSHPV